MVLTEQQRKRWSGTALFPPGKDSKPWRPIPCEPMPGGHDATHQVQGFYCAAHNDGYTHCPGNDHGGWLDPQAMMAAFAEAFGEPGCDVRLLIEPLPTTTEN